MVSRRGFTLIELLVVLAVIAALLTLVAPRYWGTTDHAREVVLRDNLTAIRLAIDQFKADRGRRPETLGELVASRYLRTVPQDPVTGRSDSWRLIRSAEGADSGIEDVQSGAAGHDRQGRPYHAM